MCCDDRCLSSTLIPNRRRLPAPRRFLALLVAAAPLAVAALGVAALAGCGKKGEPLPPVRLVPKAGADLAVRQRGPELLLSVAYPQVTVGGLALPGLAAVEVLRLARPLAAGAEPPPLDVRQFTAGAEVVETLRARELTDATEGNRLLWRRQLPATALSGRQALTYAVRFVTPEGERSEPSNQVTVVPGEPPPAPRELTAEAKEEGVEVRWADGGEEIGGYRVYRRLARERTYGEPLASLGTEERRYLDDAARYDERYIYAVTSVAAEHASLESAVTAEREIDYRDRFPPPAPEGLVALAESGQVRLTWQASPAPDVAGYHVYRRRASDGEPGRVTASLLGEARYLDTGLTAGVTYVYRVTAVDRAGNEGSSSREATAAVR